MILTVTNSRRAKGFTLVEVIAVVVIISILMSAAAVPFVHTLNTYKGQYDSEAQQLEAQRAIAEFTSYGRKAAYFTLTSQNNYFQAKFYDSEGDYAAFLFSPLEAPVDGMIRGNVNIIFSTVSYQYYGEWRVPEAGPFQASQGGVAFYFEIDSAGAPVPFQTFIHSTSL